MRGCGPDGAVSSAAARLTAPRPGISNRRDGFHDYAVRLFVDSGAWIALRSRRDQHHAEADRAFRAAVEEHIPLVTTSLVVAEVHRLTLFRVGADAAMRTLERIDASPSVTLEQVGSEDHLAARQWLERLAPRPVTYADAVSFAVMQRESCTHVLGFDDDFVAAGFERWRV